MYIINYYNTMAVCKIVVQFINDIKKISYAIVFLNNSEYYMQRPT